MLRDRAAGSGSALINRSTHPPPGANFQVAPRGWETDETWVLLAGPYAAIYGSTSPDDEQYIRTDDGPLIEVNKTTGEYTEKWGVQWFLWDEPAMTEVGDHPEDDDD